MAQPSTSRRRRLVLLAGLIVYVLLVIWSNIHQSTRPQPPLTRPSVRLAEQSVDARPSSTSRSICVTYLEWPARTRDAGSTIEPDPTRPAVLLLHGSPGEASNFNTLAPLLASRGYRVIAPDLPGFGQSEKWIADYSIRAHAAYTLALMDTLGIHRAHAVGWSMGGGVVLHMADDAPDRIASATLMASIGTQESEGSGDYWFEHFKYAVGYAGLVVGVDLLPHFGALTPRWFRHTSMRNFFDTDMRPLRRILESTSVPILILHGRYDVLAGVRGAEEAAALSPASRLIVTDDNHFLPVMQAPEMADRLVWLFARHDQPSQPPLPGVANLSPARAPHGASAFIVWLASLSLRAPWWLTSIIIALLATRRPRATLMLSALAIDTMTLDFGVAALGIVAGWTWKDRRERKGWAVLRLAFWVLISLLLSLVAASQLVTDLIARFSWPALFAFVIGGAILLSIIPHLWTWRGRRRLLASWSRLWHQEWWPANLFYAPLWPWWAFLSLKHRGPLTFTCANPGIPGGGGLIGESKSQILNSIPPGFQQHILKVHLIEPGGAPDERARRALAVIESSASAQSAAFSLPVILKPDQAFRGFAMKLARTEGDIRTYFQHVTGPVILQQYHPGPEECGLFWVRTPHAPSPILRADGTPRAGRIFAVTRKRFPIITGDGKRTLERLILDHPRLRCQWRVFLARHRARLHEVLPVGEPLRLALAGNHAQGTLFTDGADLITPALQDLIDRLCDSYRGPSNLPYDFGRMDVRYISDDLLRQGEGLGIVEMNGSTSEATNLYDPSFSVLRSYSILFAQWRILYELGAWRRKQGIKPVTILEIARHWIAYHRQKSGSSIAD